jgi:hypothetical protein
MLSAPDTCVLMTVRLAKKTSTSSSPSMSLMPFCIANKALLAHKSDMCFDIEPRESAETLAIQAERSSSGVGGGVRQPAQVLAHLHADVAFLTPRRAPRVANNPVPDVHVKTMRTNGWYTRGRVCTVRWSRSRRQRRLGVVSCGVECDWIQWS